MGVFIFIAVTLLFLGTAESADDVFDLSDALSVPEAPQRNQGREQCPNEARDVVFLIDGSTSMRPAEFVQLKMFVALIMKSFPDNTQFSLLQFSNRFEEHFDFMHFNRVRNPDHLLNGVRQLGGSSYTATGITKAVKELFTPQKGARSTAKKFLVVVTDGEKTGDPLEYEDVVEEANRARITRFAVGVGLGFTSTTAQRELHAIASHPATEHVIVVRHFTGLRDIQSQLKEKICASHGAVVSQPAAAPLSPDTCTSRSDPQVLQKLERVLSSLDQVTNKLNMLVARQGKCV
ncbi:integrin alpha-X-like [Rhineura floridana]|uniref:integrin alpha-X-like n=1 Tax=Rhineura floridana TaxID=261503 RepID=UPI002AC81A55|nr:integrin alpha-X-like [Rhineura floridana]